MCCVGTPRTGAPGQQRRRISSPRKQASANASYLRAQGILVSVTQLWLDPGRQRAYVSVSADVQSLLPSFLPYSGSTARAGVAQTRMERGP